MPATLPTGETIIMTTPNLSLEERVTVLETRLDTILPTLATKADIVRLEGKMDAMNERLEGRIDRLEVKMDNMGNRLLIKFGSIAFAIAAIAVAAAKYL